MREWLIYGANGYTGALIAREAVRRGLRPVLAGRRRDAVHALARELELEARAFSLEAASEVDAGLAGCVAVLHCAGPFSRTARPMVEACLRRRLHYLDITGEVPVFEALHGLDRQAREAGVMLLPGAGFDVVPSDCLAAQLAARLPDADRLALAFHSRGGLSHGTAATIVENLGQPGLVRRGGVLTPVPSGWRTRRIDFGRGPRLAVTIPWGDVSTAYHTTGIPDVEVYVAARRRVVAAMRLSRLFGPLLRTGWLRRWLRRRIDARAPGPGDAERAAGWAVLWGEVRSPAGARASARLRTPEGYTLTVATALALIERALDTRAVPGFQTPAGAYGPDLVREIGGVSFEEA